MPAYYNPYMNAYPISYNSGSVYNPMPNMQQPVMPIQQQIQQPQYMINVDGENAAKAWQPVSIPQPNTIIPLFDSDGQHVYFKTYDAYGRMNPIRKGRIVFDDEINVSETPQQTMPDMSGYVTKDDLEKAKEDIMNSLKGQIDKSDTTTNKNNQNGNNFRGEKR